MLSVCILNSPPGTPSTPSGPSSGWPTQSLTYSTSASDADGDTITYTYNWGDGTQTSGGSTQSHAWSSPGSYCVRAFGTDQHGAAGSFSSCRTVTIHGDCSTGSDAGNSLATATPMSNPGSCTGFLAVAAGDTSDFYEFTVAVSGKQLNIDMPGPACEGQRYLLQYWDHLGREGGATNSPPSGGFGCSGGIAIANAQAGTWRVEVRYNSAQPAPTQSYVLSVATVP